MALILLVGVIPSSVAADDERQTRKKIVFWNLFTGSSSHEVVTELVALFNHRQQEHVVEQVDVPDGHITAKILPAVAGGVPPDLTIFDASWSPVMPPVVLSCPSTISPIAMASAERISFRLSP